MYSTKKPQMKRTGWLGSSGLAVTARLQTVGSVPQKTSRTTGFSLRPAPLKFRVIEYNVVGRVGEKGNPVHSLLLSPEMPFADFSP